MREKSDIKHSNSGGVTTLFVYVDDIILTRMLQNMREKSDFSFISPCIYRVLEGDIWIHF